MGGLPSYSDRAGVSPPVVSWRGAESIVIFGLLSSFSLGSLPVSSICPVDGQANNSVVQCITVFTETSLAINSITITVLGVIV
jgi:hypothetical protein